MTNNTEQTLDQLNYHQIAVTISDEALDMIQTLANLMQPEPRYKLVRDPANGSYHTILMEKAGYVAELSNTINAIPLLGPPPLWELIPQTLRVLQARQHKIYISPASLLFYTSMQSIHDLPHRTRATPITTVLEYLGQRILLPPPEAPPLYTLVSKQRIKPNAVKPRGRPPKIRPEDITDPTDPRYIQAEPDVPYNY